MKKIMNHGSVESVKFYIAGEEKIILVNQKVIYTGLL